MKEVEIEVIEEGFVGADVTECTFGSCGVYCTAPIPEPCE